jgi:hypothetical protein
MEPSKKPKIPGKRFTERLADGFINFFGDDNKFDDKEKKSN